MSPGEDDRNTSAPRAAAVAARAAVVAGFVLLSWWALRPMPRGGSDEPLPLPSTAAERPPQPTLVALDESAFHAPLWIAPPAPEAAPSVVDAKPEPPPPPLKLQILAIVTGELEGSARALLYDPELDKPLWVVPGQSIGRRTVERVTGMSVEIRDGAAIRTLALRPPTRAESGSPLERALRSNSGGVP